MKTPPNRAASLNSPENTQIPEGANHIHFHHKLSDNYVLASAKQPGRCAVEVVCHACHASAMIFFFMPPGAREPADAKKVFEARDNFANKHWKCRTDPSKDYTLYCPTLRASKPDVYDFARTFS